jgi:hypothetical protein
MKRSLIVPAVLLGFVTACFMSGAQAGTNVKGAPTRLAKARVSEGSDDLGMSSLEQSLDELSRNLDIMAREMDDAVRDWTAEEDHRACRGKQGEKIGDRCAERCKRIVAGNETRARRPEARKHRIERRAESFERNMERFGEQIDRSGERLGEKMERFGECVERWGEEFGRRMERLGEQLERLVNQTEWNFK